MEETFPPESGAPRPPCTDLDVLELLGEGAHGHAAVNHLLLGVPLRWPGGGGSGGVVPRMGVHWRHTLRNPRSDGVPV